MRRCTSVPIIIALLLPAIAWGLGADHPASAVSSSKWPKGLAELVNVDNRVHGYFVNQTDVFFFKGDAGTLNKFLARYAYLPDTQLRLVIHPGKLLVQSPWDEAPREITADWKLYAAPHEEEGGDRPKSGTFVARVDVWLSGSIELKDIEVPKNVPVSSGGEIEQFVKARQKNASK